MLRRMIGLLIALVTALLGALMPTAAPAPAMPIATYTYDSHFDADTTTHAVTERGPLAPDAVISALGAVDPESHGAVARPTPAADWTYTAYDHTGRYAQPDGGRATTRPAVEARQGDLRSVGAVSVATNAGSRAVVDAGKYDYLFGRVASGGHNAARSAQNAQQLARIGVYDNAAGRSLLSNHFDDVIARTDNIARTFSNKHGTFQIRDSLFSGPGGFLKFESTQQVTDDGFRLTTVIPMGGP